MNEHQKELTEVSKPTIHRLVAQIDAMSDTFDCLEEVTTDADWLFGMRSTACVFLIQKLLGVEVGCESFLDYIYEEYLKQERKKATGENN